MKRTIIALAAALSLLLPACATTPTTPVPVTSTPEPTVTPLPTATNTPVPTFTSTIAPTETPLPPTPTLVPEPLKVGLLAPFSFPNPTFGISPAKGAQLAVDEWNARTGVLGRKIELEVADTECDPERATEAFNQLVEDEGIHYIIGDICSSSTIILSELAEEKGVVLITPTSTVPQVTVREDGNVRPNTYRACVADPYQGTMLATFAYEEGHRTAFLLYDSENDYSNKIAGTFEERFTELGGKIVGSEVYTSGQENFKRELSHMEQNQAEVLVVPGFHDDVNRIGRQARELGVRSVMMGTDGWDAVDLDLQAVEGGYFTNHHSSENPSSTVQDWNKRFGEAYPDELGKPETPDMVATLSYDAMNMLLAAIEQAGANDPELVRKTLAEGTWELVTGVTRFDESHNPIKPFSIMGIQDAKVVFVRMVEP